MHYELDSPKFMFRTKCDVLYHNDPSNFQTNVSPPQYIPLTSYQIVYNHPYNANPNNIPNQQNGAQAIPPIPPPSRTLPIHPSTTTTSPSKSTAIYLCPSSQPLSTTPEYYCSSTLLSTHAAERAVLAKPIPQPKPTTNTANTIHLRTLS